MDEPIVSLEEMITFIEETSKSINKPISRESIELVLDLQEEFLNSKGLIEFEELDEDETPVKFFGAKDDYMEFFQEWDGEVGFHCYGLMIETKIGEWKVIED